MIYNIGETNMETKIPFISEEELFINLIKIVEEEQEDHIKRIKNFCREAILAIFKESEQKDWTTEEIQKELVTLMCALSLYSNMIQLQIKKQEEMYEK